MDRLFDSYGALLPLMSAHFAARHPKGPADSDFAWRRSVRAKAFDALRGMLPAGATSNLGIYASGQAYEALLVRMRAHPLPEAQNYGALMLEELRKVIPSWVKRVDSPTRGIEHSRYLQSRTEAAADAALRLVGEETEWSCGWTGAPGLAAEPEVRLVDFDPRGELKMVAAMLFPYSHLSEATLEAKVEAMSVEQRLEVIRAYQGTRANRRHRPGRALERAEYRFEIISDYGAFRDLQRHRLLSIDWQHLTPWHGYTMPAAVAEAGAEATYHQAMERSAGLYEELAGRFGPFQAAYAVALAFRIRYSMQLNAREAMHMLELRTSPQGHPEYRRVCQQMHRLIADQAGHRAVAAMMSFVDHEDYTGERLERLEGENRAQQKKAAPVEP